MAMKIPEVLTDALIYIDSGMCEGSGDVTLPSFNFITAEISGAGIAGSLKVPIIGHTQSVQLSVTWRIPTAQNFKALSPEVHEIVVRASIQNSEADGKTRHVPVRYHFRAMPVEGTAGTLTQGASVGMTTVFEVEAQTVYIDGKKVLNYDKKSYVYETLDKNGQLVDFLKPIRENLGR